MVLDSPAGTMVYGGVYPAGDGDVAPFPVLLLKAHRGEVSSGSFDAESPVETRACAIPGGGGRHRPGRGFDSGITPVSS